MRILVTAGNTLVPIDRVRGITNVFTGRTGGAIALHAHRRGHHVTLLTSHADAVVGLDALSLRTFRTFDDLRAEMRAQIEIGDLHAVIHSAAVSDFQVAGTYAADERTQFDAAEHVWKSPQGALPKMIDCAAGKIKSDTPELWLRLTRTPKLVDLIRSDWGFRGLLVKFKLEVGVSDDELLEIAEASRQASSANLMVANTLEGASSHAFIGPIGDGYQRVSRRQLAERLVEVLEQRHSGEASG